MELEANARLRERFAHKRILIVTQFFAPEDFRINRVVEALTEFGASCTVLTGLPNYPTGSFHDGYGYRGPYSERLHGAHVVRVPVFPRGSRSLTMVLNYISYPFFACLLGAWRLRGQRFDVVFNWESSPVYGIAPAVFIGWLKRIPVLTWVLDLWPQSLLVAGVREGSLMYRLQDWISGYLYRKCDRLLLVSEAFRVPMAAHGVEAQRMVDFPNFAEEHYGTKSEQAPPEPPELKSIRHAGHLTLTYAGNIGTAQGVEFWLDAAEILRREGRKLTWLFLGTGRAIESCRARALELDLGDCVHFLGRFPADRMPEFFGASDALLVSLVPSAISAITVPGRIHSFLAMGKPMIAAIDGASASLLAESGAGVVAAPAAPEAIAEAVRRFIALSPAERTEMGRAGQRYFEKHLTLDLLIERLAGVIDSVVTRPLEVVPPELRTNA